MIHVVHKWDDLSSHMAEKFMQSIPGLSIRGNKTGVSLNSDGSLQRAPGSNKTLASSISSWNWDGNIENVIAEIMNEHPASKCDGKRVESAQEKKQNRIYISSSF